jgi:hypothetical protein
MTNLKIIGTLTIILMLSAMSGSALAQTSLPGVEVGNIFKYTYTFSMNSSGSPGNFPELIQALIDQTKDIEWVQITVTNISVSSVTAQLITQFKNDTQQTNTGITDVSTGQGNLTLFLVASNLNPNDQIYPGNDNEKINETITRTYPSGTRQVNLENVTMYYDVSQEELSGFNITGPIQQTNSQVTYWDKQLGSLVEMSYKMATRSEQINADISINIALVESNVYTVPEYPSTIMVIALITLMASTIAVIKLRFRFPKTIPF